MYAGSAGMACSPSSDIFEMALLYAQRENVHSAYFLMRTHAERWERERDEARGLAERLRKYAAPDMVLPWENAESIHPKSKP